MEVQWNVEGPLTDTVVSGAVCPTKPLKVVPFVPAFVVIFKTCVPSIVEAKVIPPVPAVVVVDSSVRSFVNVTVPL